MDIEYWIRKDHFIRDINVIFSDWRYQDLNLFLRMSRESDLHMVLEAIREDSWGKRIFFPGEYLKLTVQEDKAEAEINFFGDRTVVEIDAKDFAIILEDYLGELEKMYRNGE